MGDGVTEIAARTVSRGVLRLMAADGSALASPLTSYGKPRLLPCSVVPAGPLRRANRDGGPKLNSYCNE